MARRSKAARKKAIDDTFLADVPPFGIPGASIFLAVKLAKLMIDHEEMVGLGANLEEDLGSPNLDTPTFTRRGDIDPRTGQVSTIRSGDVAIKVKRKVSAYSKQFGIELKKLKKKHPRTSVTKLMKRAHTATKKKMPKKKGRLSKGRRTIAKSGQFARHRILPRRK